MAKSTAPPQSADKEAKLAKALRANLRRRKAGSDPRRPEPKNDAE